MVTKSIIDRILILAAVVCAAGLAWQLTVLLTSKGQGTVVHKAEAVLPARQPSAAPVASDAPSTPSVRVVYPPEQGLQAPKTTTKASDDPVTAKLPIAPTPAPAPASPTPSAAPSVALQPQAAPFVVPSAVATAPVLPSVPAPAAVALTAAPAPAISPASAPVPDPAPAAASASIAPTPPADDAAAAAPGSPAAPPAADAQPQPAHWSPEPAESGADQTLATATTSVSARQTEAASPVAPAAPQRVASLGGAPTRQTAAPGPQAKRVSAGGVNINNASVEALDHLRGGGHIGQAIARHRPYRSVEDLVKKRVLRRDLYEQIKNQIATQ